MKEAKPRTKGNAPDAGGVPCSDFPVSSSPIDCLRRLQNLLQLVPEEASLGEGMRY
jgi:hypothetical protein